MRVLSRVDLANRSLTIRVNFPCEMVSRVGVSPTLSCLRDRGRQYFCFRLVKMEMGDVRSPFCWHKAILRYLSLSPVTTYKMWTPTVTLRNPNVFSILCELSTPEVLKLAPHTRLALVYSSLTVKRNAFFSYGAN
jgi:hypothetical protein